MNDRFFIISGASLAFLAVLLGAFGAHGLGRVLDASHLNTFEVGVRYQIYHALGILFLAVAHGHASPTAQKHMHKAGLFFIFGTILFSGSLYLLSCNHIDWIASLTPILGPITPLGGLCLMIGWIFVGLSGLAKTKET